LWADLTRAILAKDMEAATDAKTTVEDAQRELRRKREEGGEKFVPRFFELRDGRWVPKLEYEGLFWPYGFLADEFPTVRVPDNPQEAVSAVQEWIWSSQTL
jgi:hypothetical protein